MARCRWQISRNWTARCATADKSATRVGAARVKLGVMSELHASGVSRVLFVETCFGAPPRAQWTRASHEHGTLERLSIPLPLGAGACGPWGLWALGPGSWVGPGWASCWVRWDGGQPRAARYFAPDDGPRRGLRNCARVVAAGWGACGGVSSSGADTRDLSCRARREPSNTYVH